MSKKVDINNVLFPITRGEDPLFSFDNKHILATRTPRSEDLKNAFNNNDVARVTTRKERNLFDQEGLNGIDDKKFYRGGIRRKRRRQTIRKKKRFTKRRRQSTIKRRKSTKRPRR
jgi:hypothetical protein